MTRTTLLTLSLLTGCAADGPLEVAIIADESEVAELRKGVEWDELMETIREEYGGIFYSLSNFDVVAWFHPIEVERVPEEEKRRLEAPER